MGSVNYGFHSRAATYLAQWSLTEALSEAKNIQGFWHPTGFMIFHTSRIFEGMPVRVHCWPSGLRPIEPLHPPLHTHVWPLAARVLYGNYAERVYVLKPLPEGNLVRYDVQYHARELATVRASSDRFSIVSNVHRIYSTDDLHHLDAGAWHETMIPDDDAVVTVMVTGQPELDSPMLAGAPGFSSGVRNRERVSLPLFLEHFGHLIPPC